MENKWWDFTQESTILAEETLDAYLDEVFPDKDQNLCSRCERNEAESPHSCPYQSDINDDRKSLCNCCDDCYSNCLGDI